MFIYFKSINIYNKKKVIYFTAEFILSGGEQNVETIHRELLWASHH